MLRAGSEPEIGDSLESQHQRADARRNHDRLIEAALELFGSDGVSVPIEAIAARAGVGVGTVYRHFPTKEALFEAVIARRLDALVAEARRLISDEDPAGAFLSFLERVVCEGLEKRDLAHALSIDCTSVQATTKAAAELFSALDDLLQRAQRAQGVRSDITMADVFGLLAGPCLIGERKTATAGSVQRMLKVVWDGLRVDSAHLGHSLS